jgi:N4-gp56 family major capsid protein
MADTLTASGLRVQQWDDDFFTEYVRENRFKPYMGANENSIVQVREDLTKKRGDRLTFNLVNRLTNAGVTGSNILEGNEEELGQRSHLLTVNKLRNAVRIAEMEEIKNAIDLRDAARVSLRTWIGEKTRDQMIDALGSINGVSYLSATQAQRDAWLDDNNDRALFGAALSNTDPTGGTVAYDFSDSLGAVDNTTDKLTPDAISLMKRIAQSASPKIRPIMTKGDEEWYVLFSNSRAMRDLKTNTAFTQSNREARDRGKDNPLFRGADYVWDGVIIREIPELSALYESNGSIVVAPTFLCGAQALGIGWAKRTTSKTKEFDYGDKYGVAIEEIRGIEKLRFGTGTADTDDPKDHGVVTGYFAAVAD